MSTFSIILLLQDYLSSLLYETWNSLFCGFSYTHLVMEEKLDVPPATSNPLFPPIPEYGAPTFIRRIKWKLTQLLSFYLYMAGTMVMVVACMKSLAKKTPEPERPFKAEEERRAAARKTDEIAWKKRKARITAGDLDLENDAGLNDGFVPTEGGPDAFKVDVGYYARRVGLDSETVKVQTEDGHILTLWHIFDPREYLPLSYKECGIRGPECIDEIRPPSRALPLHPVRKPKYPILMLHGLLQSAGVYCTNDEHSLAFWLCKQGYDVWLGNNRAGFTPEHVSLSSSDPKMWAWNVRHMGTLDLPALTARVLSETGFQQLGFVGHSQGTTQTIIALSTSQRPSLGSKLSVFCGLAPAAYAGSYLDSAAHFKMMRNMSIKLFRRIFGINAFIPIIGAMGGLHGHIPESWIGTPSFVAYNYMFGWGDSLWDRGVRDRNFMFAPTYISVEGMKWWVSGEGFAKHGCLLETEDIWRREEEEDAISDFYNGSSNLDASIKISTELEAHSLLEKHAKEASKSKPWYDERSPPMAFWIAGTDDLVNGKKLMNRFKRGREPYARIVHENVIEEYSHLDVVWACDVIDKVGVELRDVFWRTCNEREKARVPNGCKGLEPWVDDRFVGSEKEEEVTEKSGGRKRVSWPAETTNRAV